MTNCLLAIASLRGFASSHASPISLFVIIIAIPAGVAFAVLSYVMKQAGEDGDEVTHHNEETRYTMMSTREWLAQRYVPCALEPAIVKSIPLVKYAHTTVHESSATARVRSLCVVCLAPFEESEEVKVLPPCQHAFHPNCIDPWFETHSTCPICRRTVTVPLSSYASGNEEAFSDSCKLMDEPSMDIVIID